MKIAPSYLLTSLCSLVLLAGCANPTMVRPVLLTDASLSCAQLDREIREAERVRNEAATASDEKASNIVSAIFDWPAPFATQPKLDEAIAAADQRKKYLTTIQKYKNCPLASSDNTATTKPPSDKSDASTALHAETLLDMDFRKQHPPTQFASLADKEAVPYINAACREHYANFVSKVNPKAFAISSNGGCGFSWTTKAPMPDLPTDPAKRALLACERGSKAACRLYVIDNDVVWIKQ